VLDRHEQAIRFHKFVEHVLQNVLSVTQVRDAPPNEVAQPGLLSLDRVGDPLVLFECHPLQARDDLHQPL
jgi:hypothetical protein